MTEYRHFLLDLEGNYTEVLRDRLITADYHDGGFIGFGGEVRSGGDITLHRYIYNEDNLSAQALRQDERFNDEYAQSLDGLSCQSLLE